MKIRFFLWCSWLLILLPLASTGCTSGVGGRISASPAWDPQKTHAGKVLLILTGDQEEQLGDRTAEIAKIAADVLANFPQTTVLNAQELPSTLAGDIGDNRAAALGKDRGADSVCLLTPIRYSELFYIGLSPGWVSEAHVVYSLRLIDAHTGDLLVHAINYTSYGGNFVILTNKDLARTLQTQLTHDLTPHPPLVATK